ncbi:MAG: 4-diphosphocytidyl-2-C-methyl-D-erythritol kinase [Pirellulaceae bacterium]|nr:MAG: 4-diphosphocytidyl-2-C-methyl-D-erythritol kinase [Pirellulaceae bacterium]
MRVQRRGHRWEIRTPAKLNLFLAVGAPRPDGFHELESLLLPIDLCDRLVIEPTAGPGIELDLVVPTTTIDRQRWDAAWRRVPRDDSNLVVQAARQVQARCRVKQGCRIKLIKEIPAMAGLGGGSSDAAAAVVGTMAAWNVWDRALATDICQQLGSDVPFFLGSPQGVQWAWATGRGEKIDVWPIPMPRLQFCVTALPSGLATREVYAAYHPVAQPVDRQAIWTACESGEAAKIGAALRNDLQSSARQLHSGVAFQLALFHDAGIRFALMSGSGTSCFGILENERQRTRLHELAAQHDVISYDVSAWRTSSVEDQLQ